MMQWWTICFLVFTLLPFTGGSNNDTIRAEIVLLIDDSGSVGNRDFNRVVQVVREAPDYFPMGENESRVAVVVYSDESRIELNLTAEEQVVRSFSPERHPGITRTDMSMQDAKQVFADARPNAVKIVILITDGEPTVRNPTTGETSVNFELTEAAAAELRKDGAHLFTIYVGAPDNDTWDHLLNVTTDQEHIVSVDDHEALKSTIFAKFRLISDCIFTETCRFDDQNICSSVSWRHNSNASKCKNDPPPPKTCEQDECEATCEKWKWQVPMCDFSNSGRRVQFGGPSPDHIFKNCPEFKHFVCPIVAMEPSTSSEAIESSAVSTSGKSTVSSTSAESSLPSSSAESTVASSSAESTVASTSAKSSIPSSSAEPTAASSSAESTVASSSAEESTSKTPAILINPFGSNVASTSDKSTSSDGSTSSLESESSKTTLNESTESSAIESTGWSTAAGSTTSTTESEESNGTAEWQSSTELGGLQLSGDDEKSSSSESTTTVQTTEAGESSEAVEPVEPSVATSKPATTTSSSTSTSTSASTSIESTVATKGNEGPAAKDQSSEDSKDNSGGLPNWVIPVIVVVILCLIIILVVVALLLVRRKKKRDAAKKDGKKKLGSEKGSVKEGKSGTVKQPSIEAEESGQVPYSHGAGKAAEDSMGVSLVESISEASTKKSMALYPPKRETSATVSKTPAPKVKAPAAKSTSLPPKPGSSAKTAPKMNVSTGGATAKSQSSKMSGAAKSSMGKSAIVKK